MPRPRKPGGRGLRVTMVARARDARAAAGLSGWLERAAPRRARGAVTVALVSDGTMRGLNRQFRGADYVTDVLSFGAEKRPRRLSYEKRKTTSEVVFLGDIAIALGVARRQAREQGHSLGTELRILALHGLLHLLGYDHETDRGQMNRIEARLRRRAGLSLKGERAERGEGPPPFKR